MKKRLSLLVVLVLIMSLFAFSGMALAAEEEMPSYDVMINQGMDALNNLMEENGYIDENFVPEQNNVQGALEETVQAVQNEPEEDVIDSLIGDYSWQTVTIKIEWDDNDNEKKLRPDSVTLFDSNHNPICTVYASENWTTETEIVERWSLLPDDVAGYIKPPAQTFAIGELSHVFTYTIKETDVDAARENVENETEKIVADIKDAADTQPEEITRDNVTKKTDNLVADFVSVIYSIYNLFLIWFA